MYQHSRLNKTRLKLKEYFGQARNRKKSGPIPSKKLWSNCPKILVPQSKQKELQMLQINSRIVMNDQEHLRYRTFQQSLERRDTTNN